MTTMRRFSYILFFVLLAVVGCMQDVEPISGVDPERPRVRISFQVAVPGEPAETRAMGIAPTIDPDGFYIAVFGGSGFFNEWVKAEVTAATANYDSTNATVYSLSAEFSVSDSRLRVHFIANCPTAIRTSPPISGSTDTEENVFSKIRSQHSQTYNDGYWQKIILPNGIKAEKNNSGVYVATAATLAQFHSPIVLVRNFARVYLRNVTPSVGTQGVNEHQLVKIKKYGLAYAPSEGVIAPILSSPYTSNSVGEPITVADDDETTPVYFESFLIDYQKYSLPAVTAAPYNYGGYSPADQAYNYYPGYADPGAPQESDLREWDDEHPENNVLFVYERTMPTGARRATRVIIKAERIDQNDNSEGDRFYALDIVNNDGVAIPLLRNQSYTVLLKNIESGSGESDINKAASATSATVTGDPNFQELISISDGKSSIGTSYTEKFFVQPQLDSVMFRYIPTNVAEEPYAANQEGNELVSIKVGSVNTETGVFTELTPAQATSQGILAFNTSGDKYRVWIDTTAAGKAISYVRDNNRWVVATSADLADASIEKWGMIKFELNESYKDEDNYFTQERTQAIHVTGRFKDREMSRNVIIKTSPRQQMKVRCLQKYVFAVAGEEETVQILIPTGLSRSVFPLEFIIEPNRYSLTPYGDILPVDYGTSIDPDNNGPAFYFIKTIGTENDYKALPTVQADGASWKVFECHFKTTLAQNACTVYVQNRYFTEASSHDLFYNFAQRLFTWNTVPGSVYRHGNTTFTFTMDNAHNGNTCVWWDPENEMGQSTNADQAREKGLSTSNRVLPPIMSVTLNGFTPQYDEYQNPVTPGLVHSSGNTYLYYVGQGEPTSDMATNVSLALTATGAIGSNASVTLSTVNLTESPLLYASLTSSNVAIQGAQFTNVRYSGTYVQLGTEHTATFQFTYVDGLVVPITVSFTGCALNGTDNRFSDNGDGTYTFTPTNPATRSYTFDIKTTTRFSPAIVTLTHEDYELAEATLNRSESFSIPVNALYARNIVGGDLVNFTTGNNGTYIYLNNSTNYAYLQRSRYANTYLNNTAQTVTLSNFNIENDDATVYFIYQGATNYNNGISRYYYATSTLSELMNATSSNRVTLNFWGPVRVQTNNGNFATNNLSYSEGGVTVSFNGIDGTAAGYITLNNNRRLTVSVPSGYHLTKVVTTYNSRYANQTVVSGGGTVSGNASATTTWTASANNPTSEVVLNIVRSGNNAPRMTYVYVELEQD